MRNGEAVARWLDDIGMDTVTRGLRVMFGNVDFWTVSAREAMLASRDGAVTGRTRAPRELQFADGARRPLLRAPPEVRRWQRSR